MQACLEGLKKLPVELITPEEADALAGIVSFRHPGAEHINRILHQRNVHIMSHAGRLRVAIHGYNTMDDVGKTDAGPAGGAEKRMSQESRRIVSRHRNVFDSPQHHRGDPRLVRRQRHQQLLPCGGASRL